MSGQVSITLRGASGPVPDQSTDSEIAVVESIERISVSGKRLGRSLFVLSVRRQSGS